MIAALRVVKSLFLIAMLAWVIRSAMDQNFLGWLTAFGLFEIALWLPPNLPHQQ